MAQRALLDEVPWQPYADSPTTKYYTDWGAFERLLSSSWDVVFEEPRGSYDYVAGCGGGSGGPGGLLGERESRLAVAHYRFLRGVDRVAVGGGVVRVGFCLPRGSGWAAQHLVVEARGSSGVILDIDRRGGAGGSVVVEVLVEPGARLEVFARVRGGSAPLAVVLRRRLGRGSVVSSAVAAVGGGGVLRVEDASLLAGEASRFTGVGAALATRGSRVDYVVDVVHAAPDAYSRPVVRGYALGDGLVVARGVVRVLASGRGADTVFEAEAVMLGGEARAYAAPMMEIETGDVRVATHRAAQYRVPEDVLFYLGSRGLSEEEAVALVVRENLLAAVEGMELVGGAGRRALLEVLGEVLGPAVL